MTKPLDADEVLLRVRNYLRTRQPYLEVEQHAAEEASRAVVFENVMDRIECGIAIIDVSTRQLRFANQMMADTAGLPVSQLLKLTLSELEDIGFDVPLSRWAEDLISGDNRAGIGKPVLRRKGRAVPIEVFTQSIHDGVRQLIVIVTRDIIQRRAAEQAVQPGAPTAACRRGVAAQRERDEQ